MKDHDRAAPLRAEIVWLVKAIAAFWGWSLLLLLPLRASASIAIPAELLSLWAFLWFCLRWGAGTRWQPPRRPVAASAWALLVSVALIALPWSGAVQMLFASLHGPLPRTDTSFLRYPATPFGKLSTGFALVIIAPVLEEFVFRGWLQGWLRQRLGPLAAIALASACWAILHGAPAFPPIFVLGLLLGTVVWITGSIWPAVAIHAFHNGISYLPQPLRSAFDSTLEPLLGPGAGPLRQTACMLVTTVMLLLLLRATSRANRAGPWRRPSSAP